MRWESLTPAQRWETATPEEMLEMALHRERGFMVVDDINALPSAPLVIAEGSVLPAWAISEGIVEHSCAVWLLPTPQFHQQQLVARGTVDGPARLYKLLGPVIHDEAIAHGVTTITIDGSQGIDDIYAQVEQLFAEHLTAGPHANTLSERQQLLREMNEAVIAQVRGYYARPWATGDPDLAMNTFVCECGTPTCEESLTLTIGEATSGSLLAPGHIA